MTGSRQLSFLGRLVPLEERERNSSHQRNRRKYRETLLGRTVGMPAGISAREKTHTRTAEILANEHQVEVLLISNHWVMCHRKYALQIPQDSTRERERERERERVAVVGRLLWAKRCSRSINSSTVKYHPLDKPQIRHFKQRHLFTVLLSDGVPSWLTSRKPQVGLPHLDGQLGQEVG